MNQNVATIIGALILGGALMLGSNQVAGSLDRAADQLDGIQVAMDTMAKKPTQVVAAAAGGAAAPAAAPPRRGPDPNRKYEIALGAAPVKGPQNASVTIVEFSDFQCPFCNRVNPTLKKIQSDYGDKVKVAFKHLPLAFHAKAPAAHKAAVAADQQGKFWEMHDKIFANQAEMSPAKYVEWAGELGLDVEKFKKDLASDEIAKQVDADKLEAAKLGVTGTPAFFINGRYLSGAQPFEAFKVIIDDELGDA
jgi:protein-disulfide isomerase